MSLLRARHFLFEATLCLCCLLPAWAATAQEGPAMKLTSTAFTAGGAIPAAHTCVGTDTSPPLAWSDVPANARSLALIVDDPDAPDPAAPKRTWVHWVLHNLSPTSASLSEGAGNRAPEPPAQSDLNDWAQPGYRGPCPPIGRHRYFFKLYALDTELTLPDSTTKASLEKAMEGHVLSKAELLGTFQK
jgi:Raf kinase inhibitor-like YbhB/YbcL family protein